MPLLIHNSVAVGHMHNSLSVGHMHKGKFGTCKSTKWKPWRSSSSDGFTTSSMGTPKVAGHLSDSSYMAIVLRARARDFMVVRQECAAIRIQTVFRASLVINSGLLRSFLRWIQLITCLLLSRCYITSSITVEQMYTKMASRHRVCHHCIQIIKIGTIPTKLYKRESTKQFHNSKIKFPLMFKKVRPPTRKLKTIYKASRPNLFV